VTVLLLSALVGLAPALVPQAPARATPGPLDVIRASNELVRRLIRPGHRLTAEEHARLVREIESTSDFPTITREVLASRWAGITPDQQRIFAARFARLVALSSVQKMGRYRAERVEYLGQQVEGDRAVVRTRAYFEGRGASLDYDLRRFGEAWRIVDYRLNGVSNAANYRKQFDRILDRESFEGLLARIEQRLAQMSAGDGQDSSTLAGRR